MPKYFSKAAILAAYHQMRLLSDEPSKQGQTQKVSALRYVTALDAFCAKYHRDCDTTNTDDKAAFTRLVGDVVSIRGSWYTKNFYSGLAEEDGYKIGTNFYSANVVPNSGLDPSRKFTFPKGRGRTNKDISAPSLQQRNIINTGYLLLCFKTKNDPNSCDELHPFLKHQEMGAGPQRSGVVTGFDAMPRSS